MSFLKKHAFVLACCATMPAPKSAILKGTCFKKTSVALENVRFVINFINKLLTINVYLFIYPFMYKDKERSKRQEVSSHPMIHSSISCRTWGGAKLVSHAKNSTQVFHMADSRHPTLEPSSRPLRMCKNRELESTAKPGPEPSVSVLHAYQAPS